MKIFYDINDWLRERRLIHQPLGFIPTMGNLHSGHASLVKNSLKENALSAVSIFVNPTQFNQKADFIHYPRTLAEDLQFLEQLGVDFCLVPKNEQLYPDDYIYKVIQENEVPIMEDSARPNHFTGVLTIVMKLLNIVKPDICYVGEKDFQQFNVINNMTKAFFMDVKIKVCPTIREASGLACSSRNNRLDNKERELAEKFANIFQEKQSIENTLQKLSAINISVEYLKDVQNRRFIAVKIGKIRLIDNITLDN